jgi:ankyrin repeat protein
MSGSIHSSTFLTSYDWTGRSTSPLFGKFCVTFGEPREFNTTDWDEGSVGVFESVSCHHSPRFHVGMISIPLSPLEDCKKPLLRSRSELFRFGSYHSRSHFQLKHFTFLPLDLDSHSLKHIFPPSSRPLFVWSIPFSLYSLRSSCSLSTQSSTSISTSTTLPPSYPPTSTLQNSNSPPDLLTAIRKGDRDTLSFLLHMSSVDPNSPLDPNATTALHIAAHTRNIELARILLDGGANVHLCDAFGRTPLHFAARAGSIRLIRLFISCGADVTAQNHNATRAIHNFCYSSPQDIDGSLIQSNRVTTNRIEPLLLVIRELLGKANVDITNNEGETPLHWAIRGAADPDILDILLRLGASIHVMSHHGVTPLDLVAKRNSTEFAHLTEVLRKKYTSQLKYGEMHSTEHHTTCNVNPAMRLKEKKGSWIVDWRRARVLTTGSKTNVNDMVRF